MKAFLKIAKIFLLVFFLSLISLFVTGWLLQERIVKYALTELSNTFQSPLATDRVTFSLVSDFPLGSIKFDNIWIGSYQWNENNEIQSVDTLAKVSNLFISVDTKDLINSIFTIRKVELQDGYVKYEIDKDGISNFDFLLDSDTISNEVESEPLDLTAEGIEFSNITFIYNDEQQDTRAKVLIPNINGSVKLENPKSFVQLKGKASISDLNIQDTQLNRMQEASLDIDLAFRYDTLNIASLAMQTEELSLTSSGSLFIGDQMFIDLNIQAQAPSLAALTKYAPDGLLSSYEISQVSGAIALNSRIKGIIEEGKLPHYTADMNLSKGSIRWQSYPMIYNVGLRATATNGSANNNSTTAINLTNLSADFSGSHIDLNGRFNNLDQLHYDISTKLDIDLEASKPVIPDSLVQHVDGNIQMQLSTYGTVPDSVDSHFIEAVLKNSEAQVVFDQINLQDDSLIELSNFSAQLNYSDHKANLNQANAYLPEYKLRLTDNRIELTLKGNLLKPESTQIEIPSFHLASEEGTIDGSASIQKLKEITFSTRSRLNLNLGELKRFAPDTLVNDMNGEVIAAIQSHGKLHLDKIDSQLESILYDQSNFDVTLKNISLDMKDTLLNIKKLNGRIVKKDHQIGINNLKGSYYGIDFNIETTSIDNLFNTALRNQTGTLRVDGIYHFGDLDYKILGAFASSEETNQNNQKPAEPTAWNYEVKGTMDAKSFSYDNSIVRDIRTSFDIDNATNKIVGNLTVSNITYDNTLVNGLSSTYLVNTSTNEVKGKLAIKDVYYEDAILNSISALYNAHDSVYTIDQLKFNAFDGKINTSAKVTLHENDEMEVEIKNDIDHIDMSLLMQEMKDFNQRELTNENFSGELTSDNLFLRMVLIGDSIIYDDLRMTGDLKFENGGIYNYPPVQDIAQYLKKRDNLDTLSFKTINTHLFLFKDAVYVPRTYVVTSEFDVEAIGMQSFGEDYQYHVGINLKEILKGKKESDMDESTPVDRKRMIRLKASGRKGKYKSGFDKVKDRDAMLTKVKTQEKILEFRFQPQFFNFDTNAEKL